MKAKKSPAMPIYWSTEWKIETGVGRKSKFKSFDEALKTRGINLPLEPCCVVGKLVLG
jgi:hypothetical protein